MFYVANRLYDLDFTERTDIPKYHEDVTTYEVTQGKHIGVLFIDPILASQERGAWCGAFRGQRRDIDGNMVTPWFILLPTPRPIGQRPCPIVARRR